MASFHLLPVELVLDIVDHLNCCDRTAVSKVCRYFRSIVAPACSTATIRCDDADHRRCAADRPIRGIGNYDGISHLRIEGCIGKIMAVSRRELPEKLIDLEIVRRLSAADRMCRIADLVFVSNVRFVYIHEPYDEARCQYPRYIFSSKCRPEIVIEWYDFKPYVSHYILNDVYE